MKDAMKPIKKSYLLAGAAILLLLLSIQFAFRRTWEAWQIHQELSRQQLAASDVSYQPDYLERKNRNLDRTLALFRADSVNYRTSMLLALGSVAEKEQVQIRDVATLQFIGRGSYQSWLQQICLQGDFFSLLRFLNEAEQAKEIGKIRSVVYQFDRPQSGFAVQQKLQMQICLESIK